MYIDLKGDVNRMVAWTHEQQALIDQKGRSGPEQPQNYKCPECHHVIPATARVAGACPVCGATDLAAMCPLDNVTCQHGVVAGTAVCPVCGAFVCPVCGCHDVNVVSRVTGYLGPVGSWNSGKQQEFRDRVRTTI